MRKLFLSLVSVLASTSLMFGVAAAQSSSCTIDNTGPDSTNTCKVSEDKDVTINCTNKADVVFINKQQASSGDSLVLNNTNGGYATSGNAQNYNSTDGKLDVSCGPAKVAVSPTPSPTPTPTPSSPTSSSSTTTAPAPAAAAQTPAGGQGAGQAAVLPATGSNSIAVSATIASVVLATIAAASRFAFSAYQRLAVK
jgi:hypothetical protein